MTGKQKGTRLGWPTIQTGVHLFNVFEPAGYLVRLCRMNVVEWLLDSDPAIRWQVLRDLVHAPAEAVAAERARVATEGWGARLLALQGEDGQWAGGACFPARSLHHGATRPKASLGLSTLPTLQLLYDFGVDPRSDRVRRAVALVRDHCRWEHAGQPFFSGEVEPCINGRTVTLGIYFGQDVDGVVARLLGEQLEDGGWNCEAENGSVRSSFATTINVLEGLLAHERATGGSSESIAARRRGEEYLLERKLFRRKSTGEVVDPAWLQFSFPTSAGTTTCCVPSNTSARPGDVPDSRYGRSDRFAPIQAAARWHLAAWRTRIPARSTLRSRTATVGPAGGTRCGRCASSAGMKSPLPESSFAQGLQMGPHKPACG